MQVGDASTVFWADRATALQTLLADLFGEDRDDPDRNVRAVQALLDAVNTGRLPVAERDVQFYVLGLAPNAARMSVRFWLKAPLLEVAPRVLQHSPISHRAPIRSDPPTPSIFRLLSSLALQGKLENVPPRLAGEWMRAILEGLPYPAGLLNAAVIRCKAERDVSYLRAAVLKAWLNRDHRRTHAVVPGGFALSRKPSTWTRTTSPIGSGGCSPYWSASSRKPSRASTPRSATATTGRLRDAGRSVLDAAAAEERGPEEAADMRWRTSSGSLAKPSNR